MFAFSKVFPGGLTSAAADGKLVSYVQSHYQRHIKKHNFLFDDLMSRINALRELFEETGILLYRNRDGLSENIGYPDPAQMHSFNDDVNMAAEWRQKVLDDPFAFEQLYRTMNCVPDILSLVPWARLQTPWGMKRRWDTRFYLALIHSEDIRENLIRPLGQEIVQIDWLQINDKLQSNSTLRFPPPTVMKLKELDIICNRDDMLQEEYQNAFRYRNAKAIRPKFAVCPVTKQAVILWHRDYMYNALDVEEVPCDPDNERNGNEMHRIYLRGKGKMNIAFSSDRLYESANNVGIRSKL